MGTQSTLYERLGGESGVRDLVKAFYDRVLQDPALAPFFLSANFDHLFQKQFEFFSVALGAPVSYSGISMRKAHSGRGIDREHFAAFLNHMIEILREWKLSEEEIQLFMSAW